MCVSLCTLGRGGGRRPARQPPHGWRDKLAAAGRPAGHLPLAPFAAVRRREFPLFNRGNGGVGNEAIIDSGLDALASQSCLFSFPGDLFFFPHLVGSSGGVRTDCRESQWFLLADRGAFRGDPWGNSCH